MINYPVHRNYGMNLETLHRAAYNETFMITYHLHIQRMTKPSVVGAFTQEISFSNV